MARTSSGISIPAYRSSPMGSGGYTSGNFGGGYGHSYGSVNQAQDGWSWVSPLDAFIGTLTKPAGGGATSPLGQFASFFSSLF